MVEAAGADLGAGRAVHGRVGPPVAVRAGPGRAGFSRFHLSIRTATTALHSQVVVSLVCTVARRGPAVT
jgi:hypothetical protein